MKVLISAFEPFGGESLNPSSLILEQLPDALGAINIIKVLLPVTFYGASKLLSQMIDTHEPDFVVSLGQAGGRSALTIEKIGINLNEAPIPDNAGQQPRNEAIAADHPDGYFTTLPIDNMLTACRQIQVPCQISYSAGTYVCNHVMFSALAHIQKRQLPTRAGFIHIPFLPEQVLDKPNQPSMTLSLMLEGIQAMLLSFTKGDSKQTPSDVGTTH